MGEHLDVHPVVLVFSRVVRAVGGDAVDREQGAVEDDLGRARGDVYRLDQVRCRTGQESDRFVDVAADGRRIDAEPGGESGAGVAAA